MLKVKLCATFSFVRITAVIDGKARLGAEAVMITVLTLPVVRLVWLSVVCVVPTVRLSACLSLVVKRCCLTLAWLWT